MSLIIRKKSAYTWEHYFDGATVPYITNVFNINNGGNNTFQLVDYRGSNLQAVPIADITLYDDTSGGVAETFATFAELNTRLGILQYPPMKTSGGGGGGVESLSGVLVNNTDPVNPIVNGLIVEGNSQIKEIDFVGATVTDDGGGKVTVTVTGGGGGIPDAPNDTFGYIRKDLAWTKINIIDLLTVGNREINLAIDENILFDGGVFAQVISCAGLGGDTTIIIPISIDGTFPEYIIHNETDYVIDLVSEEPILAPLIGNNFIIPKNSLCFIRPMYNTDLVVGWSVTYQLNEVSGATTLQEVLDEGKTATFTDGTYTTNINIGDGGIVEFTVFKNDFTEIQTFYLSASNSRIYSVKFTDETLEEGKTAIIDSNQGRVILEEQDNFLGSSATKSLKFEDFTEAETVGDPVIDYRIKKKLVTGTYYLVDEEYVNNGFIPLSGTTVGNPVTGDVDMAFAKLIFNDLDSNPFIKIGYNPDTDETGFWYDNGVDDPIRFAITPTGFVFQQISAIIMTPNGLNLTANGNGSFYGIDTNSDLSAIDPTNLNIYAQRQYVQNKIQNTTITVELFDDLEVDFYAPDDLKINSTAVIVGSGTITLKVNNVAYTLGALINQGNKITVTTTALSTVVNLVGKYE